MNNDESKPHTMMDSTNLLGQVGMILCWYWGDEADDEPGHEGRTMIRAVELVPSLLRGEYDEFAPGDWWLFFDALGSYPDRTAELEELYEIAKRGHDGTLDLDDTVDFLSNDGDDIEDDIPQNGSN